MLVEFSTGTALILPHIPRRSVKCQRNWGGVYSELQPATVLFIVENEGDCPCQKSPPTVE
jgi:hypothetical protein